MCAANMGKMRQKILVLIKPFMSIVQCKYTVSCETYVKTALCILPTMLPNTNKSQSVTTYLSKCATSNAL
jgi:hypothetical protein